MSHAKRTLASALWAFSSGYANLIIGFIGNLLLARILAPEDFGVFALASSLLMFINMFTGFGSQEAIMQCRDESIDDLIPTAFWFSLLIGCGVAVAGIVLGLIMHSYHGWIIGSIIIIMSILVPINSMANAHAALLRREMNYRPVALTQSTSAILSFSAGVVAAFAGAGPWALMVRQGLATLIYWVGVRFATKYRLPAIFNRGAALWIWDFGYKKLLSQISEIMVTKYPSLLIGTFMGNIQLGYYTQSFRLALLGQQFTQGSLSPILIPMFAIVQDSTNKLKYGLERLGFWMGRALLLFGTLILLLGKDAVTILYGAKWATAGYYFEKLFIFFIFLPFAALLKEFLTGAGYITMVARIQWGVLILFVLGISISAYCKSMTAVIWTVNISQVLTVIFMGYAAHHIITIDWWYIAGTPLLASLTTILVGQRILNHPLFSTNLLSILLSATTVILVYLTILLLSNYRALRNEILILITASRKN